MSSRDLPPKVNRGAHILRVPPDLAHDACARTARKLIRALTLNLKGLAPYSGPKGRKL